MPGRPAAELPLTLPPARLGVFAVNVVGSFISAVGPHHGLLSATKARHAAPRSAVDLYATLDTARVMTINCSLGARKL